MWTLLGCLPLNAISRFPCQTVPIGQTDLPTEALWAHHRDIWKELRIEMLQVEVQVMV